MKKDYTITIECRDEEGLSKGAETIATYECEGYMLLANRGRGDGTYLDLRGFPDFFAAAQGILQLNKDADGNFLRALLMAMLMENGAYAPTDQEEATADVQH